MKHKNKKLKKVGLVFRRTGLGEAIFIPEKHIDEEYAIGIPHLRPSEWTPNQLRAMADYMEENPNCTIFDDGSGKPVEFDHTKM